MASTAARASLPAISATNSSTLRVEIVCICANWSSKSRDDRASSGCSDVVGLLTTVGVEIAACFSSREIKMAWQPLLDTDDTETLKTCRIIRVRIRALTIPSFSIEFSRRNRKHSEAIGHKICK